MGLDRNNKLVQIPSSHVLFSNFHSKPLFCSDRTPCGFAFVEYYLHSEALASMRYISGTKLDERIIRCDLDPGYKEGRQFGRGKSGGQVSVDWDVTEVIGQEGGVLIEVGRGRYEMNTEMTMTPVEVRHLVFLPCCSVRPNAEPCLAGGWGHEAAQAKRRRELAAADTYAAEGGLGRDGANVPVGASADGEHLTTNARLSS
jgi:hypothetical protein